MAFTGSPIYGNYHGYYSKRPFVKDSRLALLDPDLFAGKSILDVGCNEGWVTCEIAQWYHARKVVGVDIDDTLIRTAWKRKRSVWSQQEPDQIDLNEPADEPPLKRIRFRPDDNSASKPGLNYFPSAFEHTFGPLSLPPFQIRGKGHFPHNLSFKTADWVVDPIPDDEDGYDVVVAFSVSKWIHLNGGDEGLRLFFSRIHAVLPKGGAFILEPQAWETYSKAKRMDPKLKENASKLKLRPGDFDSVLAELGFGPAQHLGTTGEGGFRRPVDVYTKLR